MRKVIVNSTPLIALCRVQLLDLLHAMYGEITIPEAVFAEVTAKNDEVRRQIQGAAWIRVEAVQDTASRKMYSAKLHAGEVEVMMLAQQSGGEHLVVIDDAAARRTALFLGLTLTGTIGVLIKAREKGLVDSVQAVMTRMEEKGIYFSRELKERVKRLAKE